MHQYYAKHAPHDLSLPYKLKLKERGIPERNYVFMGYLKESSDLVHFYRGSSVYLAPTMYENLPIRVLEAMSCGTPVVASTVCAIPEVIENGVNGILVRPGSVEELSESICLLLGNPELRNRMGNNARQTILEKFSWTVNASKTLNVYQQITEKNSKRNC